MLKVAGKEHRLLAQRAESHRLRRLRSVTPISSTEILIDGQRLVNFASNDYLGLSQHPLLKARAVEYTQKFGAGSGASRLVCGNIDCYDQIEQRLAQLKHTEAALIFSSGYQTNATVLSCLTDAGSTILLDKLSHNSLLHGVLSSRARWSRFKHNDYDDLERRLSAVGSEHDCWIASESVFSMDGDRIDLKAITNIAENFAARLFIDEAHATGVLGPTGMGIVAGDSGADIIMGTFGKAAGSFGAYIACSSEMRDYLINFCPGIIYSTALPPAVLGAIDAALEIIPAMENERRQLLNRAQYVRDQLKQLEFDTGNSSTQIIPCIVGADGDALELAQFLEANGMFVPAIRPPTVPEGSARIRLSLSASHSDAQIEQLLGTLKRWRDH